MTTPSPRPSRVSLTKLQRESAAGVELLAICREVTADGQLSEAEISDLRGWLERFSDSPLAARAYLDETLRRVLADGVISPDELADVYSAIEKIVPPDIRTDVVGRRKARDAAERARNEPLDGWDFMVAGCRYEGRAAIIERHCRMGEPVYLVRDTNNDHSHNAIEVRVASGHQIGYVPEADARQMARLLDDGRRYRAEVKKILTGGRSPIPVIIADFFADDAAISGLTDPKSTPPHAHAAGCLVIVGAVISLAAAGHLLLA